MKMAGKILLDSNVLIDFFRGEQSTIDRISHLEEMAIPIYLVHLDILGILS